MIYWPARSLPARSGLEGRRCRSPACVVQIDPPSQPDNLNTTQDKGRNSSYKTKRGDTLHITHVTCHKDKFYSPVHFNSTLFYSVPMGSEKTNVDPARRCDNHPLEALVLPRNWGLFRGSVSQHVFMSSTRFPSPGACFGSSVFRQGLSPWGMRNLTTLRRASKEEGRRGTG